MPSARGRQAMGHLRECPRYHKPRERGRGHYKCCNQVYKVYVECELPPFKVYVPYINRILRKREKVKCLGYFKNGGLGSKLKKLV